MARVARHAIFLVTASMALTACALLVGDPSGYRLFPGSDDEGGVVFDSGAGSSTSNGSMTSTGSTTASDSSSSSSNAPTDGGGEPESGGDAAFDAGVPVRVATQEGTPEGIVATATALFWADNASATIRTLPLAAATGMPAPDGGGATTFATISGTLAAAPTDLVTDSKYLYALVGSGTSQSCTSFVSYAIMNPTGSPAFSCAYPTMMCAGSVKRLVIDGNANLYMSALVGACGSATSPYVLEAPAPGNNNSAWKSYGLDLASVPTAIAGDTQSLYFAVGNELLTVPQSTTTTPMPMVLAETRTSATIQDIVVDGTNVYWCDSLGNIGVIAKSGTTSQGSLASGQNAPFRMAVGGAYVYWTNEGSNATDGQIVRVATSGGPPEVLANGQDHPWGIALGASHLYWTNSGDGSVMALATPP